MTIRASLTAAAIGALTLGGCANYATLQDPETVPEKKLQIGVGGTFTRYSLQVETTTTDPATGQETTTTESEDFAVPALTLSGRYGVRDDLEIHGMAWLPFGASLGGKYMLVGDRNHGGFVFSPGLDVSAPVTFSVDDESATLIDVYVPMHTGYRASAGLAAYLTPKYILRLLGGEVGHVAGGTLGLALGAKTQFLLEGSMLYDSFVEDVIVNGGLAFAFM